MNGESGTPPEMPAVWYVAVREERKGPLTLDQIAQLIKENVVNDQALAWKRGMENWQPAATIPELAGLFAAIVPNPISWEAPSSAQTMGFFAALFDFNFTSLITTKIIKVIYILCIVMVSIFTLTLLVAGFGKSVVGGIFMLLIGCPLYFLIAVIAVRVWLEVLIVIFRIAEHVAEIAQSMRGGAAPALENVKRESFAQQG